jgi:hypothetical protein
MADTNPSEDHLSRHWKYGPGAARIAWGTSGDFTRCVAALDRHVGSERAKRICAQWHHDMTSMWPGDKRNV